MKIVVLFCTVLASLTGVARGVRGGEIVIEDPAGGRIVVVNEQNRISVRELGKPVAVMRRNVRLNIHIGDASMERARLWIFVRDDPKSPSAILVSPDEFWASVNVARFASDGTTGGKLSNRVQVALVRAVFLLCGGGGSQMAHTILEPAPSLATYDNFKLQALPPESFSRIEKYLRVLGVLRINVYDYEQACEEGLAPAPTNDVQKAIWDAVHAMPAEPLKIKPETKKVRD